MDNRSKDLAPNAGVARYLSVLQRNELLELAEEVASLGHWMLDLEKGSLYWSDEVYRIHNVRREDYVPDVDSAIDFYHPEDASRVASLLDRAISDRQPFDFEFRLVRADGEVRLVHSRARVRVDEEDRVVAVFGTFHDITARKRCETVRRDLLALSTIASLSIEEKIGRLLTIGRVFLQTEAAFIEKQNGPERELIFAQDTNGTLCTGAVLSGAPLSAEKPDDSAALKLEDYLGRVCQWLGPEGEARPFNHGVGMRLRVNDRDFGSLWFVTRKGNAEAVAEADPSVLSELAQFVSYELGARDRLAAERRAARARAQKERELDLVLDSVPSRIWYKDGANNFLLLNEEAARSMGVRREDAQGANAADLFPEMAEQYLADDLAVIENGEPRIGLVERYTRRDGEHGWVRTDKIPFIDKDTGEPRVLAVATDITPLIEAQQSLEEQADQLRRSNHDLDQFAHVAAHDLRTPLRGMEHIIDWLKEDLEDALGAEAPEDLANKLNLLRGRVERMDRMLSDMLTFARAGHGAVSDCEEIADIDRLLSEAASWVRDTRKISITVSPVGFGLRVAPTLLQQLLSNLLTNAVRHHDRDEGAVHVEARRNASGAVIDVVDDGPGIEEAYHDSVFDAFATLKRRDEVDSTGIGLAVVQRLMHSLGGAVRLTSPGHERGCRFSLEFPAHLVGNIQQ